MMGYGRGYGYGYNNMMGGGFGGLFFFLFGVIVLVAIVLLVIWAVRASSGHGTPGHHGPGPAQGMHPAEAGHHEAVAIAKKRLASGEITPQQYDEIIAALNK